MQYSLVLFLKYKLIIYDTFPVVARIRIELKIRHFNIIFYLIQLQMCVI